MGRPGPETLAWQKLLIENGYAARTIPREYGGYGAEPDVLKSRIIAEEFTARRRAGRHRRAGHLDAGADACWKSAARNRSALI